MLKLEEEVLAQEGFSDESEDDDNDEDEELNEDDGDANDEADEDEDRALPPPCAVGAFLPQGRARTACDNSSVTQWTSIPAGTSKG